SPGGAQPDQVSHLAQQVDDILGLNGNFLSQQLRSDRTGILVGGNQCGSGLVGLDSSIGQEFGPRFRRFPAQVSQNEFVLLLVQLAQSLGGGCRDVDGIAARFQYRLQCQPRSQFIIDQEHARQIEVTTVVTAVRSRVNQIASSKSTVTEDD